MRFERFIVLIVAAGLAACAPRLYQRETLALDHAELDQFEIRYADFDSCLLRRPVPVSWKVQRPLYTLELDVNFGADAQPASLDLQLSGDPELSARFPGLEPAPKATALETGARYRVAAVPSTLSVTVLRGAAELGQETLRVQRETCRALSVGEK